MNTVFANKELKKVTDKVCEVAGYLWEKGWAERNAGNISINITDIIKGRIENLSSYPTKQLSITLPALANNIFFITGTGKRMREVAREPWANCSIVVVHEDGKTYSIVSEGETVIPTSELPTHLSVHQEMVKRGGNDKVLVHTHPNEIVAMSLLPSLNDEKAMNEALWGMHPETYIVVPKGVGLIPYEVPGTDDIAKLTVESLQNHDVVVWPKHGCLAIGKDIIETFDVIDTLNKSAILYLLCKSAGETPMGLKQEERDVLKIAFKIA